MRKTLLLSLLAGALPFLSSAKGDPSTIKKDTHLHFMENNGQITNQNMQPRNDVQFSVASGNASIFIGNGQIHYQFSKINNAGGIDKNTLSVLNQSKKEKSTTEIYRMDVALVGANSHAAVVKEEKQSFVSRFHTIKRTGHQQKVEGGSMIEAYSYDKITYKNVYPNIDWVIYSKDNELEYDFVVRPGGDPSDIKLKYSGTNTLAINKDGSLKATTPFGEVIEKAPYSFQADGKVVTSSFNLVNDVLSFNVGQYTGTLTIDPSLTWGTYYGYIGYDEYSDVAADASGNVYAAGFTTSDDFISTDGSVYFGGTVNGYDGFISSFDAAGNLNWTTYWNTFGGDDVINNLAISSAGLYIAGTSDDLGDNDAYVIAYSLGGVFSFGFYFGNFGDDLGLAVTCDNSNNIYFGGRTTSTIGVAGGTSYQPSLSGVMDGFIAKITGNVVQWSTYYGGPGNDAVSGLSADASGNLYVSGGTTSTSGMATVGQTVYGGGPSDIHLNQFSATTGFRNWGTYVGGSLEDEGSRIAVSGTSIFLCGYTFSTNAIGTAGTAQQFAGGSQDAFVAKYNNAGVKQWGTYYGGSGGDAGNDIAVDATGNVFLAGGTNGTLTVTNGYQTVSGGGIEGYMAKFNNANGTLAWGTYYGGSGGERVNAIATTSNSRFYVCGLSDGNSGISTPLSLQPTNFGGLDAFLSQFCDNPILVGPITGSNSVCAGSSQTYSVPVAQNATSYTWTLPSGWSGTSTTSSITVTVGTTGGTISVVANNGCGTSAAVNLAVTVNPIPTATITPAGATTFCQGGSVVLNANTGTGYSYAWFQGATPVGTNSSSYTANATGSYTVQITANGCSATSSAVSVTVNPNPATPTATNNGPVCTSQALNFTGNSTTAGVTYNWTGPNNFPGTQNPTVASAQAADAGTYTLTVTVNGCSATATTTAVVTNSAPATPSAINGDISVCANSTANIYNVTPDPNAASYTWTLPSGWSGTSTTGSINTTAGATGGAITVTATNGCGTSAAQTLNVSVNPLPTPVISQSGNVLTVTATYTSYQWYNGAGLISGATAQSYTAPASGSYYCIVTDANGCTGQSNTLTITVGVNNVSKVNSVNLYPNPNTGSFTIEGAFASNDGKANIAIIDVAGRVVKTQEVSVINGKLSARIEMTSSLAAGVYTIKVSSDAANTVIPFVKN